MAFGLETHDLSKDYGSVRALDGLNLQVEEGEIFGFLGPNGAGKSTTIRLLLDLIRPTHGSARIRGHDCQADSLEARRQVGYLAGEVLLYDRMAGQETVDLVERLRNAPVDRSHVEELAGRLDLDLSRRVGTYSKGNRQKLGILLALMHRPPVLLLDEPTSGLDPLNQRTAHELFREAAGQGATVFFSSHIMSEVEQLCDRVGIVRAGTLITVSKLSDLRGQGARHVKVRFRGELPPSTLILTDGVRELQRHHSQVEYAVAGDVDPLLMALAPFHVVDVDTEQPSLEDILFTYYDREPAPEPVA
ncbi:MAG: ABC transporter ATP-binding protein [Dehalococcoidia bacterium]